MMHRNDVDRVDYHNNSLANNTPATSSPEEGGYAHYPEKVEGHITRDESDLFKDYFSQARLFWNSMTPVEKQHIVESFKFQDRKSTRLNSSHVAISYAVFCLK